MSELTSNGANNTRAHRARGKRPTPRRRLHAGCRAARGRHRNPDVLAHLEKGAAIPGMHFKMSMSVAETKAVGGSLPFSDIHQL